MHGIRPAPRPIQTVSLPGKFADTMRGTLHHFYLKHDHHTAYIVAKILTFMYPDVGQFAKTSELMKILLDFEFAQGEEGVREFGEAIDRWAEGVDL